jgi:cytochrome c553
MSTVRLLLLSLAAIAAGFAAPFLLARVIGLFVGRGPQQAVVAAPAEDVPVAAGGGAPMVFHGERSFLLNCAPCHGRDGNGDPAYAAPALAGQKDWYLARQLGNFRSGARGAHPEDVQGMQMAPILRLLPDGQAVDDVVGHVARLAPFHVPATLEADAERGGVLFGGTCTPCHGVKGEGNPVLQAPMLAGQADWYLVRQLNKFRTGIRGAHAADATGMQMAAMAKTLADEQSIRDLAVYINGLR